MSRTDREQWQQLWVRLSGHEDRTDTYRQILAAYQEPHRQYHTVSHLNDCLLLFDNLKQRAFRPAEIEIGLWFHDAVYNLDRTDNEEKSACWATAIMDQNGLSQDTSLRVRELILATAHTGVPTTADTALIVDLDLAILGRSLADYAVYEQQIRQEYSHVPEQEFREKRISLLESFLTRPCIYYTSWFQKNFEDQARHNMTQSLQNLKQENRIGGAS